MANEIQFVLYNIDQEDIKVKVAIKDETIWVTQRGMAELFGVNIPAISKHLTNIYEEPSEIMLQLSYRDIVLDFFKDKKDCIIKLRSGDILQLEEEYLCAVINGKLVRVIKYSKAFKEKLDSLKANGYGPTTATIRFVLAWKGKEDENETAIILPDLCLTKKQIKPSFTHKSPHISVAF